MAEEIKFNDVYNNEVGMAICEAVGQIPFSDEFFSSMRSGAPITIELKINDREFKFSEVVKHICQCADDSVERRAAELIEEKAKNIVEPAKELTEKVESFIKDEIRRLFPNVNLESR